MDPSDGHAVAGSVGGVDDNPSGEEAVQLDIVVTSTDRDEHGKNDYTTVADPMLPHGILHNTAEYCDKENDLLGDKQEKRQQQQQPMILATPIVGLAMSATQPSASSLHGMAAETRYSTEPDRHAMRNEVIDRKVADEICELKVKVAILQERLISAKESERLRSEIERMKLTRAEYEYLSLAKKLHPRCVMERFEDKRCTMNQRSMARELLWRNVILTDPAVMQKWSHQQPIENVAVGLYRQLSIGIHDHLIGSGNKVIIDKTRLTPAEADLLRIICDLLPLAPDDIVVIEKE